MNAPLVVIVCAVLLGPTLAGCAATGKNLVAERGEYELYRRSRLAPTLELQLSAAWDYLQRYPEGRYASEVRTWFRRVERSYFVQGYDSRPALHRYLRLLPDGPHATRAKRRIAELDLAERYVREREQKTIAKARRIRTELARAAASRREFLREMGDWVTRLVAIDSWHERTSALDHELLHRFRMQKPQATCDGDTCVKSVTTKYVIPDAGGLSRRDVSYDVVLTLSQGGVAGAALVGPDLFSRLGEAVTVARVEPGDMQRRAESIGHAVQVMSNTLEPILPVNECFAEAVSPVVLRRVCRGVELRMVAGVKPGESDRISIRPVTPDEAEQPAVPAVEKAHEPSP